MTEQQSPKDLNSAFSNLGQEIYQKWHWRLPQPDSPYIEEESSPQQYLKIVDPLQKSQPPFSDGQSLVKSTHCQSQVEALRSSSQPKKQKPTKKIKKRKNRIKKDQSKNDQNMCKKYNGIAQRILMKLVEPQIIQFYRQDRYRKDYFMIMLLVARHQKVLSQFECHYRTHVENLKQFQKIKKKEYLNNQENYLAQGIQSSISCLQLFKKGKQDQALRKLYNISNLRNKNFFKISEMYIGQIKQRLSESQVGSI